MTRTRGDSRDVSESRLDCAALTPSPTSHDHTVLDRVLATLRHKLEDLIRREATLQTELEVLRCRLSTYDVSDQRPLARQARIGGTPSPTARDGRAADEPGARVFDHMQ